MLACQLAIRTFVSRNKLRELAGGLRSKRPDEELLARLQSLLFGLGQVFSDFAGFGHLALLAFLMILV
jgi:hypothetical protein